MSPYTKKLGIPICVYEIEGDAYPFDVVFSYNHCNPLRV